MSDYDLSWTEMSDSEINVYLAVERKFVINKHLSKTALRLLLLMADPMVEHLNLDWDDSAFATLLDVDRRTIKRATKELEELLDGEEVEVFGTWGRGDPGVGRGVTLRFSRDETDE